MSDQYLMGIDFGTSGVRVGLFDPSGTPLVFKSEEFSTNHPRSGWAEQDPEVWWSSFVAAAKAAVSEAGIAPEQVVGLAADATSATVVIVDESGEPLRPAIMWMDVRAADQADRIAATGDDALAYCGHGDVSAEWGLPKALWLKERDAETWARARYVVDCNDWITHRLTGEWASSVNILSAKYFHDRDAGGHARSLLEKIDFVDFLDKVPERVLDLGEVVGELRNDVAGEIGLAPGTPVAMGAIDAYSGALGLGVVEPGIMALITGSSHVMIGQSAKPVHGTGFWGSYTDAMIPGQYTVEAGQASTGSVVRWFKDRFASVEALRGAEEGRDTYEILTEEAEKLPIGSEGLIWLDYFQGNRSPHTDPLVRGAVWGLGLGHGASHLFRSLLESICYGSESIFAAMREQGYDPSNLVITGGPTKNRMWMQMHADVSNAPVQLTKVPDGPSLGSAILAAVAAGVHPDVTTAAKTMVQVVETIEPNPEAHEKYAFFQAQYEATYPALKDLMHTMTKKMED